jgi:hypothetical protein
MGLLCSAVERNFQWSEKSGERKYLKNKVFQVKKDKEKSKCSSFCPKRRRRKTTYLEPRDPKTDVSTHFQILKIWILKWMTIKW